MRLRLIMFLLSCILVVAGCKSTSTNQPVANGSPASLSTDASSSSPANQSSPPVAPAETASVKPNLDACALLNSREIESVQGEAVKETKLSGQSAGGFNVSQCFFTLPTFANSVSLLVAQKGEGAGARDPKEFWRDTFHENKGEEESERRNSDKRGEEEEEKVPPKKIAGVGDEAFWSGSRIGGALYVLKGNAYIRISIGGPSDQASKISRSKSLAEKAIARL